ncbi:MAG: hypothetical protein QOE93_794 [Actinomycetota bacterium]|nr:hypothetical protein [Actinomycetota bacterium]
MAQQHVADRPLGELVERMAEETRELVRQELHLAQLELKRKGRHAGIGIGMIGGAGIIALFGAACLVACAVLALATAMVPWAAALAVGLVLVGIAGILAISGKEQVDEAVPARPEVAVENVKADVEEIRTRAARS